MWTLLQPKVVHAGNLEGRQPVIEWVPAVGFSSYPTNLAAKRAYVEALEPERRGHSDEAIRRAFRVWAVNWKHIKVARCAEPSV